MESNPSTLGPATLLVASPRHASCELEGEAVILALDSGTYYGLDGVGKMVWELIQEPRSIKDICASICDEYAVSPQRCMHDVLRLVEHLRKAGLIQIPTA